MEVEPSNRSTQASDLSATDRSLVVMMRAGDQDAATLLYERYAKRVFGLVRSQLGQRLSSTTEPDDIVQSVFKSIFRRVQSGNYDAPDETTLWNLLAVIAVNKLRGKANYHGAQRRDIDRIESLESEVGESMRVAESASIEFLEICIREALDLLRPTDQQILSLRIQSFTIDEISEQTGRSKRTVERSLQQSRKRLSDLLLDET